MTEIEELKKKRDEILAAKDEKWQTEIELLENRVQTNFTDISIDDQGGTIAIKASLSDADAGTIAKLDRERQKLGNRDKEDNLILTEKEEDKANSLMYESLALVTANPFMTASFFANNRDKYSTEDMMKVILGFYGSMADRAKKVKNLKSFRKQPAGG